MKQFAAGVLIMGLTLALCGCTDNTSAQRVLSDQGYTDITFTGYRAFLCGDDYTFHTGFAANTNIVILDKDGKPSVIKHPVTGAVCSGWMKGNSLKLD